MRPGDTQALRIEKPAAGGWMIARAEGQVILVSGVIPGEQAAVFVDRVGKGVAYGHAVRIEEASPDRRPPFVEPTCGGCLYAHIAYPRQIEIKSQVIADALARIGRVRWAEPIRVVASPAEGYRMRSRLHMRDRRIGFFREGTHDLCDARATRQLLPDSCDVVEEVNRRLAISGTTGGELELSENIDASGRVLHFESSNPVDRECWIDATRGLPVTGVIVSSSTERPSQDVLAGDPHVTDVLSLGGHEVRLRRHVQAFFQGNRFLLRDLAAHVVGFVERGDEVVDLYAGAGLFSVAAAIAGAERVTAVEGDRFGAADLMFNATAVAGVDAVQQSVEMFTARSRPAPSTLIVDPPRTGMSKEALAGVLRMQARKVVYVSCDVATLARDTRRVVDAGYEIRDITAFDLFPNTPHVETVIAFSRSD
jgi:23S rRNA (uracil1939-C5)-methyltransferase